MGIIIRASLSICLLLWVSVHICFAEGDHEPTLKRPPDKQRALKIDKDTPKPLAQIMSMEQEQKDEGKSSEVSELRPKAIIEAASLLAAQAGFKWRYGQINEALKENQNYLDTIYAFKPLLIHQGRILPPIIAEAGPAKRLERQTVSVSSDGTYRIIEDARLITAPPDWRTYLIATYPAKETIHESLLPKSEAERKIWIEASKKGWSAGIEQAGYLFQQNLRKLEREIRGIIRYERLRAQNIVNVPMIAIGEDAVRITKKQRKLEIGQTIVRITKDSTFERDDKWNPRVIIEK